MANGNVCFSPELSDIYWGMYLIPPFLTMRFFILVEETSQFLNFLETDILLPRIKIIAQCFETKCLDNM